MVYSRWVKKIWGGEKSADDELDSYHICLDGLHTYISRNDVYHHSMIIDFLFLTKTVRGFFFGALIHTWYDASEEKKRVWVKMELYNYVCF